MACIQYIHSHTLFLFVDSLTHKHWKFYSCRSTKKRQERAYYWRITVLLFYLVILKCLTKFASILRHISGPVISPANGRAQTSRLVSIYNRLRIATSWILVTLLLSSIDFITLHIIKLLTLVYLLNTFIILVAKHLTRIAHCSLKRYRNTTYTCKTAV